MTWRTIRLRESTVNRLDALRDSQSRDSFLGSLLAEEPPPAPPPSEVEAVAMLAEPARRGHVGARIALARQLKGTGPIAADVAADKLLQEVEEYLHERDGDDG